QRVRPGHISGGSSTVKCATAAPYKRQLAAQPAKRLDTQTRLYISNTARSPSTQLLQWLSPRSSATLPRPLPAALPSCSAAPTRWQPSTSCANSRPTPPWPAPSSA
ncbi:hypothetical protein DL89DRAFT_323098, partial [Linderina pennispora]